MVERWQHVAGWLNVQTETDGPQHTTQGRPCGSPNGPKDQWTGRTADGPQHTTQGPCGSPNGPKDQWTGRTAMGRKDRNGQEGPRDVERAFRVLRSARTAGAGARAAGAGSGAEHCLGFKGVDYWARSAAAKSLGLPRRDRTKRMEMKRREEKEKEEQGRTCCLHTGNSPTPSG